jgi:hypothetical protein
VPFRIDDLMINLPDELQGGGGLCYRFTCLWGGLYSRCKLYISIPCRWYISGGCLRLFSCRYHTCGFLSPCQHGITFVDCNHGTLDITDILDEGITPVIQPVAGPQPEPWRQDFGAVRRQLQQMLEQVDLAEAQAAESMQPQSLEQVDDLEKRLTSALESLRRRRSELQGQQGQERPKR